MSWRFSQQVIALSTVMGAVVCSAPTWVVCHRDLTPTLPRHSCPHFQDDEMEGYRNEVDLVSDGARNEILSCLTAKSGLPQWNLVDYLRV